MKAQSKVVEMYGMTTDQKRAHVRKIVNAANGRHVGIRNIKKDGSERIWNCRTGVRKHLKGGFSTIAGKAALMGVWEMKSFKKDDNDETIDAGYRTVNLDTVSEVNADNTKYLYL